LTKFYRLLSIIIDYQFYRVTTSGYSLLDPGGLPGRSLSWFR